MSSINPYYTFEYSQPESYRFSHDSVFLARKVFELVRDQIKPTWKVLDLCAGCGIVGLDFLFHCHQEIQRVPHEIDFLEIQNEYKPHFEINIDRLPIEPIQFRFMQQSYVEPLFSKYDLILCNPPYFEPKEGKMPADRFKRRCRFFVDASHSALIDAVENALQPDGQAYILTRNKKPPVSSFLKASRVGEIRGTPLIRYEAFAR